MSTSEPSRADGSIDFTRYTTQQLHELRDIVDPIKFPQDANNLSEELQRRADQNLSDAVAEEEFRVRFTAHGGVRGWLESLISRAPLYGAGSISLTPTRVCLSGNRRTWLFVEDQVELSIPPENVREVSHTADEVDFQISSHRLFRKHVHAAAENRFQAARLGEQLCARAGSRASDSVRSVRDFNRRLQEEGRRSYFTPLLVAINTAVFLVMAVDSGHILAPFDVAQLTSWGANLGILTANGQWWRLVSAMFLHVGLVHLLLNMWVLWNAGRLAERLYGNISFVCLYFASGLIASSSTLLWNPALASVGASGAIFGLLGAELAFFLRWKQFAPARVFRVHWIPTAIFVAFNLAMGVLQPGTDNAAHIGGLLGGFIVGWLTARPISQPAKAFANVVVGAGVAAAFLIVTVEYIRAGDFTPSAPQQFFAQNSWYAEGAVTNLRRWQELGSQLASGILSNEEFARDFRAEVLPFWQNADNRLTQELRTMPANVRSFGELFLLLIRAREKSARTVLSAALMNDPDFAAQIQAGNAETDRADARVSRIMLLSNAAHRLRSLSDSYVVRQLRFKFQSGSCAKGVSSADNVISPTDSAEDGPSIRAALGCAAQRLFLSGDYHTLSSWMNQYGHSMQDLPDGSARFSGVVNGLDDLFEFGRLSVVEALNRAADWRQSEAGSPYPPLIEAMIFHNWAYGARGHAYANAVSPLAMELFQYRLDMAADSLDDSPATSRATPLFYETSVSLARDRNLGLENVRAAFDKGVARFPEDWSLYSRMMAALMPRWGGSFEMVDEFIVERSKGKAGPDDAMYARLYSIYASLEGDQTNIFRDADASWPRMKHGFELLRSRFPKSDYLLNRFSRFACVAADKLTYRTLRQQLANRLSASAWSQTISLASCDKQLIPST